MRLRRRVLGYLAAAAIASCVLTVGVGVVLVRHQIAKQRLSTLEAQTDLVAAVGGAPGALTPGDHVYRVGTGRPRRLGPRAQAVVLAALPSAGAGEGTIEVAGRSLIYAARPTPAGEVVLIRPANIAFAEWRPFVGSLLLAGLGGVLLAVVLSFLLARRLTRPIGELSTATRRLAAGEDGVAVPVRGEDELADLGASFNEMSRELSRAREAQSRFLESVSHELRTPLTSIRGYSEALEEGAIAPAESARVIGAEADRLERLVADLIDLARFGRADFAVAREPVDLAGVAEQAVERHLPRASEIGVELSCAPEPGLRSPGAGPPDTAASGRSAPASASRSCRSWSPRWTAPSTRRRHPEAARSSRSGFRLYRRAPLGQMLSNLSLDPLEGVVHGLAVAPDPPADLLVGVAVEVQGEHAGLELRQRRRDARDQRAELL
jgi:signal transduction histidine kinase